MARKYKLGDKWSEDFDYDGMVEYGRTIDTKTSEKTIEKYADSLEDVNYHTLVLFISYFINNSINTQPYTIEF